MVASDRISTYDVVHPTPIPDKGKVLTGPLGAVVRADARHRPQPLPLRHRRRAGGVPRPRAARARLEMLPVECVVRGYITGLGLEGLPGAPARSPGIELPDGPAGVRAAAGADLHAVDEGRGGPRRGDRLRARRSSCVGSRGAGRRSCATSSIAVYEAVAEHALERGVILADTKFEFGLDGDGDADAGRRGLHAGLLALLAGRRVRGRAAASRRSTSSTCATGRPAPAGTRRRPRRRSRTTSSPQTRERYVTAYERLAGEPFARLAGPRVRREGARPDPAQGRDPRPAGPGRRARAAGARASTGVAQRARRPARRARRRGPVAGCRRCASSCSPTR